MPHLKLDSSRWGSPILVLLLCCLRVSPVAGDDSSTGRVSLIAPGAEYEYLVEETPLPTERYAALAVFDLDGARRQENGDENQGRPSLWPALSGSPQGWPAQGLRLASAKRGRAPLASHRGAQGCACSTSLGDSDQVRFAVLRASHRFQVPSAVEVQRYSLLEVRLLYRDGVRVFLNGIEILSRNLPRLGHEGTSALATKGPQWEEFLVPLSSNMLNLGENVLGVEIRPGQHSHGVRLDVSLALRTSGHLVRGPMVARVTAQSAVIVFDTDVPVTASVEYGNTDSLGNRSESAQGTLARHHRVILRGLSPGQAIHYRVVAQDLPNQIYVFHVPPAAPEPLRFAVYGDVRGGHRVHAEIIDSLLSEAIDFVIVTGDMVLRGSDEGDWQQFFSVTEKLIARLPYYPVAGNHDLGQTGDERRHMNEVFSLWPAPQGREVNAAWHSFDVSGVHFAMLDSNAYRSDAQLAWLQRDLRRAAVAKARAIFVVTHAGPYSRGPHLGNTYAAEHYVPLLEQYNVSLLFSGHDHLYQRGQVGSLPYIVSGGGGAPLYSVRCGVSGKSDCKQEDGMQFVAKAYHYLVVTVYPHHVSVCPKRVDGTPLEACIRYPLP